MAKDIDKVSLTYHDSMRPGRIIVRVHDERKGIVALNLSPQDAVEMAERLLYAVRSEGYRLTARAR